MCVLLFLILYHVSTNKNVKNMLLYSHNCLGFLQEVLHFAFEIKQLQGSGEVNFIKFYSWFFAKHFSICYHYPLKELACLHFILGILFKSSVLPYRRLISWLSALLIYLHGNMYAYYVQLSCDTQYQQNR